MESTASRRTVQLYMASIHKSVSTRVIARGGSFFFVRPVGAVSIYRTLLLLRGCWLLLEWLFGWGAHARVNLLALLHPYAVLFADAAAVASWLVILGGLWFFRRWARLIFYFGARGRRRFQRAWAAPPLQVSAALICFLHQLIYPHAGWRGRCNVFSTPGRDSFARQA